MPMLHEMDPGPKSPDIVRMVVEIPKHSRNKYEFDTKLGVFRLDRTLYSPMHYPGDYGFIPGTVATDGDPMDVLVISDEATFTGCLMEARPVGMLEMADEKGPDEKILVVPQMNPRYDQIHTVDQIFPHVRREIEHFFDIYKELEGKHTEIKGWRGPMEARRTINESRHRFLDAQDKAKNPTVPLLSGLETKDEETTPARSTARAAAAKSEETGDLKLLVRGIKDEAEHEAIALALKRTKWNRKEAARLLNISYKALLYKIRQYNLDQQP